MTVSTLEIAKALEVSQKTVYNKLKNRSFRLDDYLILIKYFGENEAKEITGYNSLIADIEKYTDSKEEKLI